MANYDSDKLKVYSKIMGALKRNFLILLLLQSINLAAQGDIKFYASSELNDSTNVDITEVTLLDWLSYYSWIQKHEGNIAAQNVLPDSTAIDPEIWKCISTKSKKFNTHLSGQIWEPFGYFNPNCNCLNGKDYDLKTFPITGVSYEQVMAYCEFRTKHIGENSVIYRLPTPEEWTKFALKGLSITEQKCGIKDSIDKNKYPTFNYKIEPPFNKTPYNKNDIVGKINPVGTYNPDINGVYEFFGNVSEMTSVKGVSKGGNYSLSAKQCHADSIQYYVKAEKWLGFRCLIIKRDKTKK